uniref:Uncharacterized protein n=1 Tax=Sinocyclocheilus grahami TaxID=75366 RepID=A0A672PZR1_SINGR
TNSGGFKMIFGTGTKLTVQSGMAQ